MEKKENAQYVYGTLIKNLYCFKMNNTNNENWKGIDMMKYTHISDEYLIIVM